MLSSLEHVFLTHTTNPPPRPSYDNSPASASDSNSNSNSNSAASGRNSADSDATEAALRAWSPDRPGVLAALEWAAELHAAAAQLLAAKLRGVPVAAPCLRTAPPVPVGVWCYERAVELSRSPQCFNQYVSWLLQLDRVCHAAVDTDGDRSGNDDAHSHDASARASVSGAASAKAGDDEERAALAAMSRVLKEMVCGPEPEAEVAEGAGYAEERFIGLPRFPADTGRTVFLVYLGHYAQRVAAGGAPGLMGDACMVLAELARGGGGADGGKDPEAATLEAERWEEVGRRNGGLSVAERARERVRAQQENESGDEQDDEGEN